MSADNGIYIGVFDDCIKVRHAQAIENCDYGDDWPKEVTDWYRVTYFKDAETFLSIGEAVKYALKISREYSILEYGVCTIPYNTPLLDLTVEEAHAKLDAYWHVRLKEQIKENREG